VASVSSWDAPSEYPAANWASRFPYGCRTAFRELARPAALQTVSWSNRGRSSSPSGLGNGAARWPSLQPPPAWHRGARWVKDCRFPACRAIGNDHWRSSHGPRLSFKDAYQFARSFSYLPRLVSLFRSVRTPLLGFIQRTPLRRRRYSVSTPGRAEALPSARACQHPSAFRPCRSTRLRRFAPLSTLQVYCTLQPAMGFARFRAAQGSVPSEEGASPSAAVPTGADPPEVFPRRQPLRVTAAVALPPLRRSCRSPSARVATCFRSAFASALDLRALLHQRVRCECARVAAGALLDPPMGFGPLQGTWRAASCPASPRSGRARALRCSGSEEPVLGGLWDGVSRSAAFRPPGRLAFGGDSSSLPLSSLRGEMAPVAGGRCALAARAPPEGGLPAACGPLRLPGLAKPPRRSGPPRRLRRAPPLQARATYETQYARRCFAALRDTPTLRHRSVLGPPWAPRYPQFHRASVLPSLPRGAEAPFGPLGGVPVVSAVWRRSAARFLWPTCPRGGPGRIRSSLADDASASAFRRRGGGWLFRRGDAPLVARSPAPRCWRCQAMRHRSVASRADRREAEAPPCSAPGSRPPRWALAACRWTTPRLSASSPTCPPDRDPVDWAPVASHRAVGRPPLPRFRPRPGPFGGRCDSRSSLGRGLASRGGLRKH
jgi:hypothetical protein